MKTIRGFILPQEPQSTIEMPEDAQVLSVVFQDNSLLINALVETNSIATTAKEFMVYGSEQTIEELPNKYQQFIGSSSMYGGLTVHVFEILQQRSVN